MINNFNNCLETINDKHFFIQDGNNQEAAFIIDKNGQFEVINSTHEEIKFLAVDDCIDFGVDTQKCDCIVFNDKDFCFIELKTLQSDKATTKTKRRKKAEEQLRSTINHFSDEDIIKTKQLEAYVSLTCLKDNMLTKIPNISNQETIYEFEIDLNTSLHYKCKKEFN
ncbi:hypothetical protein [Sulfurimonas sp.]